MGSVVYLQPLSSPILRRYVRNFRSWLRSHPSDIVKDFNVYVSIAISIQCNVDSMEEQLSVAHKPVSLFPLLSGDLFTNHRAHHVAVFEGFASSDGLYNSGSTALAPQ